MKAVILLAIMLTCVPKPQFGTGDIGELNPNGPWINYNTIKICPNVRTTITLANKDSTVIYTLFDNILTRTQTLVLMHQPSYWEYRQKAKDRDDIIIVPMPPLKNGPYYLNYSSPDTTTAMKFLYLE